MNQMRQRGVKRFGVTVAVGLWVLFGSLGFSSVHAEDKRWDIGIRAIMVTAGGEPTNDQTGAGIFGRYRFNEKWLVGLAVDELSGDFERPYKLFGNDSPEEVDATVDSTIISSWIEREYGNRDRKLRWFWNAGLGFTSPDVNDISGPLAGGGTFDITTDAGSETLLSVGGGLRRGFAKWFGFEVEVQADQHFAEWKLTDRNNATTATLDNYTTWGINLGLRVTF